MNADFGVPLTSLKAGGDMIGNGLLMQFQADLLGVPVTRPTVPETTALGAAYAAGLAVGYWLDEQEIRDNWTAEKTCEPTMDPQLRAELYANWKKAVTRTLDWTGHARGRS